MSIREKLEEMTRLQPSANQWAILASVLIDICEALRIDLDFDPSKEKKK